MFGHFLICRINEFISIFSLHLQQTDDLMFPDKQGESMFFL